MPRMVPANVRDQRVDDYEVSARTLNCLHLHRPPMVPIGQLAALSRPSCSAYLSSGALSRAGLLKNWVG